MRFGTIDRVITKGALIKVDVFVENAIEREMILWVDLGQEYDPVVGDRVRVVEFTSDDGEFAAIPGSFKPSSSTSSKLSLEPDWIALNTRVTTLESTGNANSGVYNFHTHAAPLGPPIAQVPPPAPVPAAPPMVLSSTSATFNGSDRLKATHG